MVDCASQCILVLDLDLLPVVAILQDFLVNMALRLVGPEPKVGTGIAKRPR